MSKHRANQPIRVLIVEDSRSQRELLVMMLQTSGQFEVIGTAENGQEAIEATRKLRPDVIAMDIHLPIVDGYEATRQIMQTCPTPIVMVSNSIGAEGRRSVEALAAGALAVIRKPGSLTRTEYEHDRQNLITTLRLMTDVPVVTRYPPRPPQTPTPQPAPQTNQTQLLAIAASTGGPAAVQTVLASLGSAFPLPVLVVQHISRGFVQALVDWLNTTIPLPVRIAHQHEPMQPGTIYLPPDDHHLLTETSTTIALQPGTEHDRYCPSANNLFHSVARTHGKRAIGVILTGMGDDGADGLKALHTTGAHTIAQDEASSVVYGMPHAAVEIGAINRIESITHIGPAILNHLGINTRSTT